MGLLLTVVEAVFKLVGDSEWVIFWMQFRDSQLWNSSWRITGLIDWNFMLSTCSDVSVCSLGWVYVCITGKRGKKQLVIKEKRAAHRMLLYIVLLFVDSTQYNKTLENTTVLFIYQIYFINSNIHWIIVSDLNLLCLKSQLKLKKFLLNSNHNGE